MKKFAVILSVFIAVLMCSAMIASAQTSAEELLEKYRAEARLPESEIMFESESYITLDTEGKNAMLAQSTTLDTWSPKIENKWKTMATTSAGEFVKNISKVDSETQAKILQTVTTTNKLSPQVKTAWYNLAKNSSTDFQKALNNVNGAAKTEILNMVQTVKDKKSSVGTNFEKLGQTASKMYNRNLEIRQKTRDNLNAAIDVIKNKKDKAGTNAQKLAEKLTKMFNGSLGSLGSSAENWVAGFTNKINALKNNPSSSIFRTVGSMAESILSKWNSGLGIHSPSIYAKQSASYFVEGFEIQLNKEKTNTLKQVSSYAEQITNAFDSNLQIVDSGFKVDTSNMKIDTKQYIDYSSISGQIQTQSKIALNENIANAIGEASYDAFCKAMRDEGVKVDVEARTDEGIIFKKVKTQAEDFFIQTGEAPFPT